ncbi:hypothetical protein BY458DRAFT_546964 [Sporodiniella umbellata]|nr:hypothetical protein BY458DRAFT_546964 [Sporodiniella umbellata]
MLSRIKLWSLTVIVLIAFIQQSYAIVRVEETSEWNKDSLTAYFKKYKLQIDKNSDYNALVDTIKTYKDSVTNNARLFGSNVDNILSGFKLFLEKHAKLTGNSAESLLTNMKHQLRQLELKGQLSKERVASVLDKVRHRIVAEKLMTEAEWKRAYAHFESSFVRPNWYQRLLRLKPDIPDMESSSIRNWVQTVMNNVARLGVLSKEQIESVTEILQENILSSDIHKLGEKAWAEDITHRISQKTQLKKEQLEGIIRTIVEEVRAYKVFAIDYTGQVKEETRHWLEDLRDSVWGKMQNVVQPFQHKATPQKPETWQFYHHRDMHLKYPGQEQKLMASLRAQASALSREVAPKTNVVSQAIETAVAAASGVASQATESVKDSFSNFWSQREYDVYRRLGYTEAHIDWIKNYLESTFQNQKDSVKGKTDEAAIAIKRYLDSCKVQTPTQVDDNVHRIKRYLENWRTLL